MDCKYSIVLMNVTKPKYYLKIQFFVFLFEDLFLSLHLIQNPQLNHTSDRKHGDDGYPSDLIILFTASIALVVLKYPAV